MINPMTVLNNLRRPKILIQAARLGMANYNREEDLRFIMRTSATPAPNQAIETLLDREKNLETSRKDGKAEYSVHEHIRVLTAILAEARLPQLIRKNQTV